MTKEYVTEEKTVWTVDPTHSSLEFSVRHLMISKVKGSFQVFSGTVETGPTVDDFKATAVVKTESVTTNEKNRDQHLLSQDFFHTDNWPEITFTSTKLDDSNGSLKLEGDLTIRDVTKPVVLDVDFGGTAVDGYGQHKAALEATTKINRTDFGLTWNSNLEKGGVLVSEEVAISLDIQLVRS